MRVPPIASLETAIRLYYEKIELYNDDIRELFGKISGTSIVNLKELGREVMRSSDIPSWNARAVNTRAAYEAWGLEIDDLERRYNKLKKLALIKEAQRAD